MNILRLFLLCAWMFSATAQSAEELTVSAAASLREALEAAEQERIKSARGVKVIFNFGGSGTLQRQIEAGAPVDVFISAAPAQIDALEERKLLLPGSRRTLFGNSLVLIAPADSPAVREWTDLAEAHVRRIIIGEPRSVPAGAYAFEVLKELNLSAAVEPKLVRALHVRQALATVAAGDADAGVVYKTDALQSDRIRVVAPAPDGSHNAITYSGAVIAASKNSSAAQAYLSFLGTEPARAIFAKFGFRMAE